MISWKLSKLQIDGFKVFESFQEDFNCDFIVLDGPNGFGKTSIYDALQLLFCGEIPRIKALSKVINKGKTGKQYIRNLYWNNKSNSEIIIKAEFRSGNDTKCLMREASVKDLETKKYNKPTEFSIFKLYELDHFDSHESKKLIEKDDESDYITEIFGQYFLKNFSILNYMSQDNNPIIVPDHSNDHKSRFDQISHLINLDEIHEKLKVADSLNRANAIKIKKTESNIESNNESITNLEEKIGNENIQVDYKRLSSVKIIPQWDKKKPFVKINNDDFKNQIQQIGFLNNIFNNKDEIRTRIENEKIEQFIKKEEFSAAVRIGKHFDDYDDIKKIKLNINSLKNQLTILKLGSMKIKKSHLKALLELQKDEIDFISKAIDERDKAQQNIDTFVGELTKLNQLRSQLLDKFKQFNKSTDCPLCGFDYHERKILEDALTLKTKTIEDYIEKQDSSLKNALNKLQEKITVNVKHLDDLVEDKSKDFNSDLLDDLENNLTKKDTIQKIVGRFEKLNFTLNEKYISDEIQQEKNIEEIKQNILGLRKKEKDVLLDGAHAFFKNNFVSLNDLDEITEIDIQDKDSYLRFQYNELINSELNKKKLNLKKECDKLEILSKLKKKITDYITETVNVKNTYSSQTLGQIESLFHIYSGRLIQNYQRGLGLFIDTDEDKVGNKNKSLSFFTADGTEYDAVLSMSSGQISALTLSFFLSLNRKYANTSFILIDDPTQCMDEINIASLSDLLRVELKNRQVMISTHEQEISDYLRYRYMRGGLKAKSIHLQKKQVFANEVHSS
jgi:DNA repair protein SbcC/Rad50